jgi:hypothetical protein
MAEERRRWVFLGEAKMSRRCDHAMRAGMDDMLCWHVGWAWTISYPYTAHIRRRNGGDGFERAGVSHIRLIPLCSTAYTSCTNYSDDVDA